MSEVGLYSINMYVTLLSLQIDKDNKNMARNMRHKMYRVSQKH
jgi:hypothetical protein